MEVSTDPPRDLEESFRHDLDIGMKAGRLACFSIGKIFKKLKSLGSLGRLDGGSWKEAGETASSSRDQSRALSTAFAVEDKNAPRRRQASTSTSIRIVLKFRVCGWSEDSWDPALAYIPIDSGAKYRCREPVGRFGKHVCLQIGCCVVEHACSC